MLRPIAIAFLALLVAGCPQSLPEPESRAARTYASRCSGCHPAYAPSTMKWATWQTILPRMERNIAVAGRTPLMPEERALILAYLEKHAS